MTIELPKIIPEKSLEIAAINLIDHPTKQIGTTVGDIWYLIFGSVSYVAEKRRIRYATNLEEYRKLLEVKINKIPEDCLVEPNTQTIAQALENSKYCAEESVLREMFADLITASIDQRKVSKVHPSFAEIINQLSACDAIMLKQIASREMTITVTFDAINENDDIVWIKTPFSVCSEKILSYDIKWEDSLHSATAFEDLFEYERGLDNLVRLNLIEISSINMDFLIDVFTRMVFQEDDIGFIKAFLVDALHTGPDLLALVKYLKGKCIINYIENRDLYIKYLEHFNISRINLTRFGQDFAAVCIE